MVLSYFPAVAEDTDSIFAMVKELIDTYEDLSSIDYDKVMTWVHGKIKDHITQYACVYADGSKIAYYRFAQNEQRMELDDLYVLPPFRNQGFGSQILSECCRSTTLPVFLYVFSKNTGAIRFYERHGFQISEQVSPTRFIMIRND